MSYSEFTTKDYELIQSEFGKLREAASRRCRGEQELAVVERAFEFANDAHRNVRRRSGEPYILHPIAVALIVVNDIGLGYKSISAALLHDVVEDTDYTVEDIREHFGDKISSLVDGLTKIKTVLETSTNPGSLQAENFKRILLTLNDDVRVVLIKLADRLHNCRTIAFMPEHKRDKILSETMYIFIPLAHRLGLYSIKSEMENIWLRYKEPDAYEYIKNRIDEQISGKKAEIASFIEPIDTALKRQNMQFEILRRVKTPYSVWKKMNTKHIPFEEVYDLYAIRIIIDPPEGTDKEAEYQLCNSAYGVINYLYDEVAGRKRDWVKNPKANGYEALHTTVYTERGVPVEVQIRTRRMNDIAERGIAAHWAYKRSGFISENDSEMDRWLDKVKEIIDNPDVNALELLDLMHKDLTSHDITVFTPKGDRRNVESGSTALDFAYLIHTEIGNSAIAAKINMRLVPLSTVLKSGDRVEIITAEDAHPQRDWLAFLKTRRARSQVLDYFRGDRMQTVELGEKMLSEQCEALGYKYDDTTVQLLLKQYQTVRSKEELLFRIGMGMLKLNNLQDVLKTSQPRRSILSRIFGRPEREAPSQEPLQDGKRYVLSDCCRPIPGDSVIGFLENDGTVTIHKKSCPRAEELASKYGNSVVKVPLDWDIPSQDSSFLVRITMQGLDRVGLLNEISKYISLVMGVNMRRLSLDTREGIFKGYIDMYVSGKDVLEKMIKKLESIDGIQSVVRTEI